MCTDRLRHATRAPSAVPLWVCRLPGYVLRWSKISNDGSGEAHIVKVDGDAVVWGVVFKIFEDDRQQLNDREGLGNGYTQDELTVLRRDTGAGVKAQTYLVEEGATEGPLPYDWYRNYVLQGARQHALPPDYVATIQEQPVQVDADSQRRARRLGLNCYIQGIAPAQ